MSKKCTWHTFGVIENETLNLLFMSISFKPLADRVLIEPAAAEEKTASGIIIPDTAKEKPLHGVVKAVAYVVGVGTESVVASVLLLIYLN